MDKENSGISEELHSQSILIVFNAETHKRLKVTGSYKVQIYNFNQWEISQTKIGQYTPKMKLTYKKSHQLKANKKPQLIGNTYNALQITNKSSIYNYGRSAHLL